MLKNLVEETANNPGTGSTVTLGGAPSGRLTWRASGFTNGSQAFYFITDGVIGEWGVCTVVLSASDSITRDTVLGNSSGTTSRLNFTGTCRVYNALPAERALYVGQSSLTVNGDIVVAKASPQFVLDKTASGQAASLLGKKNGSLRWEIELGNDSAESTGNAGSHYAVSRYSDAGTYIDSPLWVHRSTGLVNIGSGGIQAVGSLNTSANVVATGNVTAGGTITATGDISTSGTVTGIGAIYVRADSASRHLWFTDTLNAEKAVIWHDNTADALNFRNGGSFTMSLSSTGRLSLPAVNHTSVQGDNNANLLISNNSGTGDAALAAMSFLCVNQWGVKMHLRHDGLLGIGGYSSAAYRWYLNCANGDMTAAGAVNSLSDPRLKDDVVKIDGALDIVDQLDGVRFTWNGRSKLIGTQGKRDVGVLADQVEAVLPEIVSQSVEDPDTQESYRTVAYDKLVPVLIEAIKELKARVEELEARK